MKKLLHIQLLPLLSGVQNFSLHLLDGIPREEFEIWVACKPGGEFVEAVKHRGYRYLPLRCLRHPISPLDLFAFLEMVWLMKRHRFDIVHTNSSKTGLLGRLAASICKVPLILHTVHGTAFHQGQSALVQKFYQAMEWFGNRFCHKVVYVNNTDRENCLKLALVPAEKALTIYNAIPQKQADKLLRIAEGRVFDPSKEDFVIGSTLRFTEQKNVVDLVSAACQTCRRNTKIRFIILGDGEYLSLCRQIVHSHALNERILLPGWDTDIGKWLQLFDAFILYSRWEAQPFSIIEAMHSALPIIGSQIPSIMELVDERSGWLVALDDQEALVSCLTGIADAPRAAFDKGRFALQRIRELCDYNAMVQGYLDIYQSLPDGSGAAR